MNLLVDIGNQNLKWKLADQSGSFPSAARMLEQNLKHHLGNLSDVSALDFANVAGRQSAETLRSFAAQQWNIETCELVPAKLQCGVRNPNYSTSELGADRWATLIGAWSIAGGSSVIVDCGTAITVDALSANGDFVGGSIMPGFRLSLNALGQRAANIAAYDELSPTLPANSTSQAVSSGVVWGTVSGVDGLVREYMKLAGKAARLFLTGGDWEWLSACSCCKFEHYPHLVLQGLEVVANSRQLQR